MKTCLRSIMQFTFNATIVAILCGPAGFASAAPGDTELVSVTADGTQATGDADANLDGLATSADGRYVAFLAPDLRAGSLGGSNNVFVRDRWTAATELVSVGMGGAAVNGECSTVGISADGRFVVFASWASNLVSTETNEWWHIFIRDRLLKKTELLTTGANEHSFNGQISADGRYVVFYSSATNLVSNDTNNQGDLFVKDRQTGNVERISVSSGGTQANGLSYDPSISADGRFIAFTSEASNLVAGDTNGYADIFLRDRLVGETRRINVRPDGMQAQSFSDIPAISAGGRYVVFQSKAWNLVVGDTNRSTDVFLWDRETAGLERVSLASGGAQGNASSWQPSVSADGRYVLFNSSATNLTAEGDSDGIADAYVRDRQLRITERVSVSSSGAYANAQSYSNSISADGLFAAFSTPASNLVRNDFNTSADVYIHEIGRAALAYEFNLRPLAIAYGQVTLGSSLVKGFTLTNVGTASLPIKTIELVGPDRTQYALRSFCGATLPVGSRCWISVTFQPTTQGYKKASLHVSAGGFERYRALRGTGTE